MVENSFLTLKVKPLFWITNSVLTNNNKQYWDLRRCNFLQLFSLFFYCLCTTKVPKKCGKVNKIIYHDILICYIFVNLDTVYFTANVLFKSNYIKSSQINKIEVLLPQLTCYFLKLITIKKVFTGPTNLRQMVDTTQKKNVIKRLWNYVYIINNF